MQEQNPHILQFYVPTHYLRKELRKDAGSVMAQLVTALIILQTNVIIMRVEEVPVILMIVSYLRGVLAYVKGDHEQAVRAFEAAAARAPAFDYEVDRYHEKVYDLHFLLARAYLHGGRIAESKREFERYTDLVRGWFRPRLDEILREAEDVSGGDLNLFYDYVQREVVFFFPAEEK